MIFGIVTSRIIKREAKIEVRKWQKRKFVAINSKFGWMYRQELILIQGIGIKFIKRMKQKRQGVVCKLVSLLKEGGIEGGTEVVREKFKQFISDGTGFHGNDEIQQGGEIKFTVSGEI